jgi:myosin-5
MSTQHRERYCTIFDVALSDLRLARYSDYENGILPLSVDESEGKSDLANMVDPHLPGILYNLKVRHFQEKPYTRFGDIVFAVNPFAWIPDLYEASALEYYSNKFVWKGTLS